MIISDVRIFEEDQLRYYKKGGKYIKFCKVCRGMNPGSCIICKNTQTVMKATFPELVEHSIYIRDTWLKLRKFNMETSGCKEVDKEALRMFGPWLPRPEIKPLLIPKKNKKKKKRLLRGGL